jgi:D-psicose/D-tagatose/L-ribulose 3-epimerase
MKLAISNIAWNTEEDKEIINILHEFNVNGLEVAPSKVHPTPEDANINDIENFKEFWLENKIEIVAMQSLLFNKSHLSIFGESNQETQTYLQSIIDLAGHLSAKALVFGSPKNRLVGEMEYGKAYSKAIDFFCELGDHAMKRDVYICIEANPIQYGCDFITSTLEGQQFVRDVSHKAIKLQLDTGTIFLNEENPIMTITKCLPDIGHFHISEPYLQLVGQHGHTYIAEALKDLAYVGWFSIEMKNNLNQDNKLSVRQALQYVNKIYMNH